MAQNIDEAMMRKFLHRVFRKSDNVGNLTVKSLRQKFIDQLGLEKLEADQREVFKYTVHDVYAFYSNNNQEQSGDQESNVDDSQTADDSSDATASSASVSSKRKKRKRGLESDEDSPQKYHTTLSDMHTEEVLENNDNMLEDAEQTATMGKEQVNQRKIISSKEISQKLNEKSKIVDSNGAHKEQRKLSPSIKKKTSQKNEEDAESAKSSSEEEMTKDRSTSTKKKRLEESEEDAEMSGASSSDQEVMRDKNISKKKKKLEESEEDAESDQSSHDSEDETNIEQQQGTGKKNGHKSKHSNVKVTDDEDDTWKKKQKRKSKDSSSTDKKKKSSPPPGDSIRLKNLKRFVRTCGLHKNYVKLFAECESMSQREKMLEKLLRKDTGFEGRITLGMCKKFKKAKEEADEIAELDCSNIITTDGGRRPTRSSRVGSDSKPTLRAIPDLDPDPQLFSRLKGVVDSDNSDSGDEKSRGKHVVNTSPDKKNSQGHFKKRRRLDSSSDEEDD